MNPFLNPVFLSKMLKSYLFDINRLHSLDKKELKKYQDKQLRKIVQFSYTVPLYHDKYKKKNIKPHDIKGIEDLEKLPIISKEDIEKYYPDGVISTKINKNQLIQISTSGTTGKSLSLFGDMFDMVLWFFYYIRALREHGISWYKNRLTIIGDFAPHTIGTGYVQRGLLSNLGEGRFFNNMQWLDTNSDPKFIVKEINNFKPDFIGGYVGMLGHIALLKEKGYGENINPNVIASIGSVLTDPLRKLLENTFNASVFEVYGATETGTIAFQCRNGCYHIMSDLVYPEFFKNNKPTLSREPGKMLITKLYGKGTPIIRYNAINDIVAPLYEECDCGISGGMIDRIYGRDDLALYFSGGRVLLPASISEIHGRVLSELKTNKIKHTRIIQHNLNNLEIKLIIDNKLRNQGPTINEIISVIKNGYQDKIGKEIVINIREVDKVNMKEARVITKVDRNKFKIKKYI